jgi:hypothetical protein
MQSSSLLSARGATQKLYAVREDLLLGHMAPITRIAAAGLHAVVPIGAGLAPDFIGQLRGAADALLAGVDARTQHRGARQGGTRGLRESLRRARNSVRVLDAFIRHALKGNAASLASWDAVRRPPAKTGRAQVRVVAGGDSVGEAEGMWVVGDRAA